MKLKTIKPFKDLKENTMREVGDEFTTTKERGEELKAYELVEEVESKEVAVKKPQTKKKKGE